MEKNNERVRTFIFGVLRGKVQGVDDLIPCDGALESEILFGTDPDERPIGLEPAWRKLQGRQRW